MAKEKTPQTFQLPKDAVARINLGQSFAENDKVLLNQGVFVKTPALQAAMDSNRSKCFFVGRRGTGKTAISTFLNSQHKHVVQIHPELFSSLSKQVNPEDLADPRQKPFQSLVSCFDRALLDEAVAKWLKLGYISVNRFPDEFKQERSYITEMDFDVRLLEYVEKLLTALKRDDQQWLKLKKKSRSMNDAINKIGLSQKWDVLILIDRLDDSWDGSDRAVMMLTALMHSCLGIWSNSDFVRPLVFLRENIFERVRQVDPEFSRLETSVVSLDWTESLLVELVERRLVQHLTAKPGIGQVWDLFFEERCGDVSSKDYVFNYCQHRPRDVLMYCSMAVESAQANRHQKIFCQDLQGARKRFSQRQLKDLGDEYSENFPQIQLVLSKFHGLSTEFSEHAISVILRKLLATEDVQTYCASWIYNHSNPYQFIELMYSIGFWGLRTREGLSFRGVGVRGAAMPAIDPANTHVVIHPSYAPALDLQEKVTLEVDETILLQSEGSLLELPNAVTLKEQQERLTELLQRLNSIPTGPEHDHAYEDIVGEVIKYCLYQYFQNARDQVRDIDGRIRRDWIVSNVATSGFWEMIRTKYRSAHVVWECKNYQELQASDFQQTAYYMNKDIGFCVIICYRGNELKKHYYSHIRSISNIHNGAMVIPLTDKDLKVFIRQALRQRTRDDHIRTIYDDIIGKIS